jgi:hypothetical protein
VGGQRGHKMVWSGSQGIPIRRQKKQTNISVICPQNNKWDFSLCPSPTTITSNKYTSYGEMSNVKTIWFESRRGRTERGILRRKDEWGIWHKSIPQEAHVWVMLLWIMTQLSLTNLCKFTKLLHQISIIFIINSNLPIYGCKLRTLIDKISLYSYSIIILFPFRFVHKTTYFDRIFAYWSSMFFYHWYPPLQTN